MIHSGVSIPVRSMQESDALCSRLLAEGVFSVREMKKHGVRHTTIRRHSLERARLRQKNGFNHNLDDADTTGIVLPGLTPSLKAVIEGLDRWK